MTDKYSDFFLIILIEWRRNSYIRFRLISANENKINDWGWIQLKASMKVALEQLKVVSVARKTVAGNEFRSLEVIGINELTNALIWFSSILIVKRGDRWTIAFLTSAKALGENHCFNSDHGSICRKQVFSQLSLPRYRTPRGEPRPNIVYTYFHFHFEVEDNRGII